MNKISIQYNQERFTKEQNLAIEQAYDLAVGAHGDQLRLSGQPYIVHPVAVAEIVAGWGLDWEAVVSAILHDVVEDTDVTLQQIAEQFGPKVAELVDGVTKLKLRSSLRPAIDSARLEASNENLRKLFLATSKDPRVILIKLADRLHNMRTLNYLPPDKRARIARESLEVFAPLANRLGMGELKGELEDLGLKYDKPEEYAELEKLVHVTTKKAQRYLAVIKRAIGEYLDEGGVKMLSIEARQKHYYSIYKKLIKTNGDIDKIYDLIAVRVIVPDVSSCYQALGILHQHYKPLIYRIKDYIAAPKPNGYQSLHTTVFTQSGNITEIQIRTPEMHEAAEHGLAAHFFYDAQKSTKGYRRGAASSSVPANLSWVNELYEIKQTARNGQEFVDGIKQELFAGRIYVYSPKGDLYELPEGSTPVDFAFAVHSGLGLKTQGAKVNDRMVPLDTKLENRDVVDIIRRRESLPSRDWLGFVATNHAKSRIRAWFRAASRESNVASGRAAIEAELSTWRVKRVEDLPKRAVADALDGMHIKSLEDMYAQLGEGSLNIKQTIRRLIPDAAKPQGAPIIKRTEPTGRVMVEGEQLPYTLAACCKPAFPQPLLGYVTRGKGITVHALGCRNIPRDTERYATCRWETTSEDQEFMQCGIELTGANRIGLIADVTGTIASRNINLGDMKTARRPDGQTRLTFEIEVKDLFLLAEIIKQLERIREVTSVKRVA